MKLTKLIIPITISLLATATSADSIQQVPKIHKKPLIPYSQSKPYNPKKENNTNSNMKAILEDDKEYLFDQKHIIKQ